MEMEEDFNKWKKSLDEDFDKWQRSFSMNYVWENYQPLYKDTVQRNAVNQEMERLDRLEPVIQMRDTQWVEEYCLNLQRK